jgi:hypothetical protein
MSTRTAERTEFHSDIITGAVEGGTGYWAQVSQYQYDYNGETKRSVGEIVGEGTRAVLHEMDDDESGYKAEGHVITPDTIAHGFSVLRNLIQIDDEINGRPALSTQSGEPAYISVSYRKHLLDAYKECDAGDLDADDCDVLVQLAIFGKVVYG